MMPKVTNYPDAKHAENRYRHNNIGARVTNFMQLFKNNHPGHSQTEFYPPAAVAGFSGRNAG